MNWILDTYSNVYQTAMMQSNEVGHHIASAKKRGVARAPLFGLFRKR